MPAVAIGIGAATSLYAAHKQASAAKDAANTQAQSEQQALKVQQEIYNQQRQLVNPYVQAGYAGLNNLMANYGGGRPMNAQVSDQLAPFAGAIGVPRGAVSFGQQMPQSNMPPVNYAAMGAPAFQGGDAGGMVTLMAPSGEVQAVPAQMAQGLIAKGARPVQGGGGMRGMNQPIGGNGGAFGGLMQR